VFDVSFGMDGAKSYETVSNTYIKLFTSATSGGDGEYSDVEVNFNDVSSNIMEFYYTSVGIPIVDSISMSTASPVLK